MKAKSKEDNALICFIFIIFIIWGNSKSVTVKDLLVSVCIIS